MHIWSVGPEDPLEEKMATPSSILAWRTPWTEEPGRLQSMGSPRLRHDWNVAAYALYFILSLNPAYILPYGSSQFVLVTFPMLGSPPGPSGPTYWTGKFQKPGWQAADRDPSPRSCSLVGVVHGRNTTEVKDTIHTSPQTRLESQLWDGSVASLWTSYLTPLSLTWPHMLNTVSADNKSSAGRHYLRPVGKVSVRISLFLLKGSIYCSNVSLGSIMLSFREALHHPCQQHGLQLCPLSIWITWGVWNHSWLAAAPRVLGSAYLVWGQELHFYQLLTWRWCCWSRDQAPGTSYSSPLHTGVICFFFFLFLLNVHVPPTQIN